MGSSTSTIAIVNNTTTDIVDTDVSGIDEFDFDFPRHPKRTLRNLSIGAKRSVECVVDLFAPASHCPVTVTLIFKDKTEDTFRIDLKHATGCCARFNHSKRSHNITYEVYNKKIYITVENTAQQKKNQEAEEQLKKARKAMRQQSYELALEHLERAKTLASEADLVKDIRSEESNVYSLYGESAFEEGLDMERIGDLQSAEDKFEATKSFFQRSIKLVFSQETQLKIQLCELKIDGNNSFKRAKEFEDEAERMVENEDYAAALNAYEAALHAYRMARQKYVQGARYRSRYFSESVRNVEEEIDRMEVALTATRQQKQKQEESQSLSLHGETTFEEGLDLERRGYLQRAENEFETAKSFFQQSIQLAFSEETQLKIQLCDLKIDGNKSLNKAIKLKKEAVDLMSRGKYEKALDKYDTVLSTLKKARQKYVQGARYRSEYFSESVTNVEEEIDRVEVALTTTRQQKQKQEAEKESQSLGLHGETTLEEGLDLERRGHLQRAENEFETAKSFFQQSIQLAFSEETQLKIQLCDLKIDGNKSLNKAIKLKREAVDLRSRGKYEKALDKYGTALSTFKKARKKYIQGERYRSEYFSDSMRSVDEEIGQVEDTMTIIRKQKQNEEAKELLKKARKAMRQQSYQCALERLERAKALATEADLVEDIKSEESHVYSLYGETIFEEGLHMERRGYLQRAEDKFETAKSFYERSMQLVFNQETQLNIQLCELKIDGNKGLNKTMELKREAVGMVSRGEYGKALDKYDTSLHILKEARKKYVQGARYRSEHFSGSMRSVNEEISQVKVAITNTRQLKQKQEAEELLEKATKAKKQKSYESALEHLANAKTLTSEADIVRRIRSEESDICNLYGEAIFNEGLNLEKKEQKSEGIFDRGKSFFQFKRSQKAEDTFARAKSFFQQSVELVFSEKTQLNIRLCELKIDGCKSFVKAMELKKEAAGMVGREEFESALKTYNSASCTFKQARKKYLEGASYKNDYFSDSVRSVEEEIAQVDAAIVKTGEEKRNSEARSLMQKARYAANQNFFDFALRHLDNAKNLAIGANTIESINTEKRHVYVLYAETLVEEGLDLEKKGHSESAQAKLYKAKSLFQQAIQLISSEEVQNKLRLVELKIDGNRSFSEAIKLKEQASEMIKNGDYQSALNTYVAALDKCKEAREKCVDGSKLSNEYFSHSLKVLDAEMEEIGVAITKTKARKRNEEAIELIKQAEEARRQHSYDRALDCLGQAKTIANQADTLNNIKTEESQVCSLYGETLFDEAVDLEKKEDSELAQNKFNEARLMLQRAVDLVDSEETKQKLHLVELKISGNAKFNKAMEFENEGSSALEDAKYGQALNNYGSALDKCKEARMDYVEGARHKEEYFAESVKIVDEEIEQVTVVLSDINTIQRLNEQIGGLRVDNSARDTVDEASEEVESVVQYRFNVQH